MTNRHGHHRLFVPLSAEPFDWFDSGSKHWEVRHDRGTFQLSRLTSGRRVELRRGYTGDSLWGTLTETAQAANAVELFALVCYEAVVPIARSQAEAIAFVEALLGDNQKLVAFHVELDSESSVTEIAFDPQLLDLVDSGKKSTTVRAGHRDYHLGPASFHFGAKVQRKGAIIRTEFTRLDRLTTKDARNDGYRSAEELVAALRRYYPDLEPDAPVTIVEFKCRRPE